MASRETKQAEEGEGARGSSSTRRKGTTKEASAAEASGKRGRRAEAKTGSEPASSQSQQR